MKSAILKTLLAIGCAVSITAISTQAQACHRSHHPCCKTVLAFHGNGYHHYSGHKHQGRPVKLVNGEYVIVQKCVGGYWKHHVWHRVHCW